MDDSWAIVASAAVTGTLTLLGTLIPKIADAIRDRGERKRKREQARTAAFTQLRRLYLAAHSLLDHPDEPAWVNVAAAAADCIPHTEPDSEARNMLISLVGRTLVEREAFIAALPDS